MHYLHIYKISRFNSYALYLSKENVMYELYSEPLIYLWKIFTDTIKGNQNARWHDDL